MENTDRSITTMPKAYTIRSDGAILIPPEVMALLRWSPGESCWFTVDLKIGRLIVDPTPPKSELTS